MIANIGVNAVAATAIPQKVTAIVDLQYGSTGKGLLAGYLSQRENYDTVVSANMPNAGHTFVDKDGTKYVNKVLPSGVLSENLATVCIGPGAVFDPYQLAREVKEMFERRLKLGLYMPSVRVHEHAMMLGAYHVQKERESLSKISSTMQGSMEAMYEKMKRRTDGSYVVKDQKEFLQSIRIDDGDFHGVSLGDFITEHDSWIACMLRAQNILVEGSQGYSLGINAGFWPYCTSRDCTVWRLISDCAVPVTGELKVIGSARVHPIRVGNTSDGNSGGYYEDQQEISWEQLGVIPETTTVTNRVRRVFTFSEDQIAEAMTMNRVDEVFLNFCNYDPAEAFRVKDIIDRIGIANFMRRTGWDSGVHTVRYMGFGPRAEDVMQVGR